MIVDTTPTNYRIPFDYLQIIQRNDTKTPPKHVSAKSGLDDIIIKEQEQRHRTLDETCERLNISDPIHTDYSHLVVNDAHKIIFNFIPKVSCTTWQMVWRQLRKHNATGNSNLAAYSAKERATRLASYRKVLFVREPMSRLLSAYISKFCGGVLQKNGHTQHIWENTYGRTIVKRYRGIKAEGQIWLNITISEFIKYITDLGSGIRMTQLNDHWLPQYIVSRPCHIKYDFIGHFENLAVEGPYLLRSLRVDHLVKFPEYHSSNALQNLVHFYKLVPLDLIQKLNEYYRMDYKLFGYSPDDAISRLVQGLFHDNDALQYEGH